MSDKYLKVITEAPILNTPNFKDIFGGQNNNLKTDEKGHIRELEFIALKNMIFRIINQTSYPYIYEVENDQYNKKSLFIDRRFAKEIFSNNTLPKPTLCNLSKEEIIKKLISLLGTKYLWGGNWSRGVEKIIKYYPPSFSLNEEELSKWQLKGIDCSGYLFEVTNGCTPRNTGELVNYKTPINIEGLSLAEIAKLVKPLDLIVYIGHVIIILDSEHTIESREKFGVIKTPIIERFKELFASKKPANIYKNNTDFVIRRWL
jgi:hypothetical protein